MNVLENPKKYFVFKSNDLDSLDIRILVLHSEELQFFSSLQNWFEVFCVDHWSIAHHVFLSIINQRVRFELGREFDSCPGELKNIRFALGTAGFVISCLPFLRFRGDETSIVTVPSIKLLQCLITI